MCFSFFQGYRGCFGYKNSVSQSLCHSSGKVSPAMFGGKTLENRDECSMCPEKTSERFVSTIVSDY